MTQKNAEEENQLRRLAARNVAAIVKQSAKRLGFDPSTGLGRDTVYAAIRDGLLVARKVGRRTIIVDDDLRQFLAGLPRAGGHEQVAVRSTAA